MAGKRVLLVEGSDDEHVLKHICGVRNVGRLDEVKPQGDVLQLLEVPGRPHGTAITAKFLDANVTQVDVLVAWLKQLFFP